MLTGTEVKSLRKGQANIAESYASDEDGGIWLINSYIPEYPRPGRSSSMSRAASANCCCTSRKWHKLTGAVERKGMTIIPLELYFNDARPGQAEARRSPRARSCTTSARTPRSATGTEKRHG